MQLFRHLQVIASHCTCVCKDEHGCGVHKLQLVSSFGLRQVVLRAILAILALVRISGLTLHHEGQELGMVTRVSIY